MTEQQIKLREAVLPPSLAPRGLCRVEAAAYIGVSASLFDRMIEGGMMPKPKHIWGRRVWDRLQLDQAFAAIPSGGKRETVSQWDEFVNS
jgi:predicted DNA-binding transcriptional regulator AlpA